MLKNYNKQIKRKWIAQIERQVTRENNDSGGLRKVGDKAKIERENVKRVYQMKWRENAKRKKAKI